MEGTGENWREGGGSRESVPQGEGTRLPAQDSRGHDDSKNMKEVRSCWRGEWGEADDEGETGEVHRATGS